MLNTEEILNIYRHSRGLFRAAEKLARDAKVIRCRVCHEFHLTEETHVVPKPVEVQRK